MHTQLVTQGGNEVCVPAAGVLQMCCVAGIPSTPSARRLSTPRLPPARLPVTGDAPLAAQRTSSSQQLFLDYVPVTGCTDYRQVKVVILTCMQAVILAFWLCNCCSLLLTTHGIVLGSTLLDSVE